MHVYILFMCICHKYINILAFLKYNGAFISICRGATFGESVVIDDLRIITPFFMNQAIY